MHSRAQFIKNLLGVFCLAALIEGCTSVSKKDGGATIDSGTGEFPTTITMLQSFYEISSSGTQTSPNDLAGLEGADFFGLFVQVNGALTRVMSSSRDAGELVFTNIPSGTRYLRYGHDWLMNPPATVDFSEPSPGRPDLQWGNADSTIEFQATNLAPWDPTAEMQFVAPNAGVTLFALNSVQTLDAGVTAGNVWLDYTANGYDSAPLIDASANDQAWLTQFTSGSRVDSAGAVYATQTLTRVASPQVTAIDGAAVQVPTNFVTPATTPTQ
jgi:hypothetical protein